MRSNKFDRSIGHLVNTDPKVVMQQTQAQAPAPFETARSIAERTTRDKIGRSRFTKGDVQYDHRRCQVTIGVWLLDRASAQYPPSFWPIRRATLHWRRHDIVVDKALNYEFQIDKEEPFVDLSAITFEPNLVTFVFGDAMRIAVGVSELSITCRRTDMVRTDWGVKGWTLAFATNPPILSTRGS
jgi:hypothetical protein